MLLAFATIGAAMREPSTFGGIANAADAGRQLLHRSFTTAADGRIERNNPRTPLLGADDEGERERGDRSRPARSDTEVEHFADEAIREHQERDEEQRKKTKPVCRCIMKVMDMAGNFFADLPPVDEPLSNVLKCCGCKSLSNFVKFSKPGSKLIYGIRQTLAVVGGLHMAAQAIDKAGHPEWVETCLAKDSYFHWISDPSRRHVCSIGIDAAPVAAFLFFTLKSSHGNRGRYILPLFGYDWPADRRYRHFISDERKAIRQEINRRTELCYVDNTTLRFNKLNDPLALMSVALSAELDHAENVIAEATESANQLAIQNRRDRDEHINHYVTENYRPKQPALFAAITDAAINELPSTEANVDDDATPTMGETATMDREALRKKLAAVDAQLKARQRSFQEATREASLHQMGSQRSLRPAMVARARHLQEGVEEAASSSAG